MRSNHRNSMIVIAIVLLVGISAFIANSLYQEDTNSNYQEDKSNTQAKDQSDEDNSVSTNTIEENAAIEYQAVTMAEPEQCRNIKGKSVALGFDDGVIEISEEEARQRCIKAAGRGQFASPRISNLLRNTAGIPR